MKLIIISGLSGSGKSIALNVLEDLNYYCIDNLPTGMLSSLADEILNSADNTYETFAVGIDARNLAGELENFPITVNSLKERELDIETFFLEADENTLIKRFSETRRKHPLTNSNISLKEAIRQERELLNPIRAFADLCVDTTQTTIHQLRDLVKQRVVSTNNHQTMSLLFESFGFKHGIPTNADFVFDVRCLPNPHWEPTLRNKTGTDPEVIEYLEKSEEVDKLSTDIVIFLNNWLDKFETDNRNYMTIAIGCTGGQHRSVYMVEKLAKLFGKNRNGIITRHRELS
ncbi:MAG: RNase adapter RapZ [Gammaproteobacteria bacterium]